MEKGLKLLWILLTYTVLTRGQSDLTCPVLGTDQSSSLDRSIEERIFLNFECPSQCRGNVMSYRYCHYPSAAENDQFFTGARLMVYRRSSPTGNVYSPVPGSITELSLTGSQASSFQCRTANVSQTFEIQENDVVGACVMNQEGGVRPLFLIGNTNDNSNSFKLYQLDRNNFEHCTDSQIGSVDTGHGMFRQKSEFILHLFANIDVSASCRVGSNPPATAPRTSNVEGIYLNTDNPVACATENTITSWHYCYYTSPLTAGQTYTMTVAVWRLDTPSNTYRLTAGSARTITLVHVATLAKIFCLEETLGSAESVFVSGGDVIGVVLPSSNPIPVVSSDSSSSSSLMRHPQTANATDLASSEVTSISGTLHLYGTLVFMDIPTTIPSTSLATAPPTSLTSTSLATPPPTSTTSIVTPPPTSTTSTTIVTPPPTSSTTTIVAPPPTSTTSATLTTSPPTSFSTPPSTTSSTTMQSSTVPSTDDSERTTGSQQETTGSERTAGSQEPTTSSNSLNNTSGSPVNEDNSQLPSGATAAIVLSLLAVLVLIGIVTILLLIWFHRQRKQLQLHVPLNQGIANMLYDTATEEVIEHAASPVAVYEEVETDHYSVPVKFSVTARELHHYNTLEAPYANPSHVDSTHEYAECLKVAKKGITPMIKEDPYYNPASNEAEIYAELRKLKIPNIPSANIEITRQLGSGQFGTVHEGTWKCSPNQTVDVAVKTLKDDASVTDKVKFLQEAAIMAQFRHPNVVNLRGVAKKKGKIMIVVELLSKGDLFNYLQGLRPDPGELLNASIAHQLLEFSQQIALGMSYLADKGFVHRDLAARNILISDSNICKVADFGMSRDLEDANYYVSSGGKIPLKWTAPEALHYKKYSTASDVWSYGCVLYEIWSVGHKPFENMGNVEVLRKLESGFRLPPPPGCPKRVYKLMMMCWAGVPGNRPGFRDILLSLLENKSVVLRVPPEDASSHSQAVVLGGPLEAGYGLYTDLQNLYST